MAVSKLSFFRTRLQRWYQKKGRRFPWRNASCSPYEVVVAEVLLQRTHADRVAKFYETFVNSYPSWESLAQAKESDLQRLIEPLGLWRRRTIALLSLARAVVLRGGHVPDSRDELESLPAVGQYIANAVLTICHDGREPLLDVNMSRVLERYFGPRKLADIRYDSYLQDLSRLILARGSAKELNWAMLDFASLVCTTRSPRCPSCPMVLRCSYPDKT